MLKPFLILSYFLLSNSLLAQDTSAIILKEPQDWRLEKVTFPLDFAPEIKYNGIEELRFAPGMFDPSSDSYFTYLLAISINDKKKFKQEEITDFLFKYYRGLCGAVAQAKKLDIDLSQIEVKLKSQRKIKNIGRIYTAKIRYFDSFTNGQEINLNMEFEVIPDRKNNKMNALVLVSSQSKKAEVWNKMYEIRKRVSFPNL